MIRKTLVIAGAFLALVPASITGAFAHNGHHHHGAKSAAMYHCVKCHMKFTAAKAKADRFKDPMDGGKLVPDAGARHSGSMKMKSGSMGGMKM